MNWFFAPQPVDHREKAVRTEHFGPNAKAYMAYDKLCRHYWHRGRLYREDRDLASVCGLSLPSFRRVKELVQALYRVDAAGFWRDDDLEAEREAEILALGLDPADFGVHDAAALGGGGATSLAGAPSPERSDLSEKRAHAARRSHVSRRLRREAQQGAGFASDAMQNTVQICKDGDANRDAGCTDFARLHPSVSGREEEEDSKKSSSSSSLAPDANAGTPANLQPVLHRPDAKSDANAGAKRTEEAPDADPVNGTADQAGKDELSLSDRELCEKLLVMIGGNVEPACRDPHSVKVIRNLMREGCKLELHIRPELELLAKSSTRLQTWRAPWLHEQIRERRDAPPEKQVATRAAAAPTTFVPAGGPVWDACQAREIAAGKQPRTPVPDPKTGRKGSWFPTPLPSASSSAAGAR